jgi:hypothetical protein
MPGEYRVEQDFGKDIAYLVNVKTGRKAQLLRPLNSQTPGSRTLTFEKSGDVRVLKAIW